MSRRVPKVQTRCIWFSKTVCFISRVTCAKLPAVCRIAWAATSARCMLSVLPLGIINDRGQTMLTHREILWIEALIILYVLLVLSMAALVLVWNALKLVLKVTLWIFLWAKGAKDMAELDARWDVHHAEWLKERIARGQPVTLGPIL